MSHTYCTKKLRLGGVVSVSGILLTWLFWTSRVVSTIGTALMTHQVHLLFPRTP
jgi:hypothetical protein